MATILARRPAAVKYTTCQCRRAFSSTPLQGVNLGWEKNGPEVLADTVPAYPYGPTLLYKQSRQGLYGGKRIRTGNNVGEKSGTKTRRTYKPNIVNKRLYSKALNRTVRVRVSTRVLKTIDKLGGVDEYLLGNKTRRIKDLGETGWWLRWAIMQTGAVQKRFDQQRQRMGLPLRGTKTLAAEQTGEAQDSVASTEDIESTTELVSRGRNRNIRVAPRIPELKFRVDRRKRVVFRNGQWVRVKPSLQTTAEFRAKKFMKAKFQGYTERNLMALREKLEAFNAGLPPNRRYSPEAIDHQVNVVARSKLQRELDLARIRAVDRAKQILTAPAVEKYAERKGAIRKMKKENRHTLAVKIAAQSTEVTPELIAQAQAADNAIVEAHAVAAAETMEALERAEIALKAAKVEENERKVRKAKIALKLAQNAQKRLRRKNHV